MLARRMASILPPLSLEKAIEASTVWSVAGLLPPEQGLFTAQVVLIFPALRVDGIGDPRRHQGRLPAILWPDWLRSLEPTRHASSSPGRAASASR